MQTLLIFAFPIFKHQNQNCFFFIEEPEIYLHPGYQRKLMDIMKDKGEKHQYFITTHSNHFLDLTLDYNDISIYQMTPEKRNDSLQRFMLKNVASGDDNILKELGIRQSSVFLSNCGIWVEGITDRWYIRKYFSEFQKEKNYKNYLDEKKNIDNEIQKPKPYKKFEEDMHYSFIEYGGSNIIHWSLIEGEEVKPITAERIKKNIFLIVDNSSEKEKILNRNENLKKKFGEKHFYCVDMEIENLLHS
jgi:predicted ATP-dependent endonuclease of OLD family